MKRVFDPAPKLEALNGLSLGLRLGVGSFMLTHGWPKFENLLNGHIEFADPFGLGNPATLLLTVVAEVLCSILIILGLGTRVAVIPLMFTMVTAAFIMHADDPFGRKELALVYLLLYGAVFILGIQRPTLSIALARHR